MLKAIAKDISLYRNAYALTFSATMGQLLTGWDLGLTGGILALASFQEYFGLDKKSSNEFASLSGNIAGILSLGSLTGALGSSYFFGRFGRKPCLLASAVFHIIGSLILSIAGLGSSASVGLRVIYLGRFLCGFGEGIVGSVITAYISESVPAAVRGRCNGAVLLATDIGLMLSFWVNYGVSKHVSVGEMQWRIPFIVQIVPGIIFLVAMALQHETPRWLVEQQRYEAATKSLAFSHRTDPRDEKVLKTVESLRMNLANRKQLSLVEQLKGMTESRSIALQCFTPFLIMIFAVFNGTNAVNVFAPQIFGGLGINVTTSGLLATGIYGVIKVVAAAVYDAFALERVGRKNSLFIGSIGQGITMLWIGGYSALHPTGKVNGAGYVSIVAVYLYGIFYCMGWGVVALGLAAEIAPYHLRPAVLSIAAAIYYLGTYATSKVTPIMLNEIKYGTYLFFGLICIVMALWACMFLPETTGYTLEDIKYLFKGNIILRSLEDAPGGWIFIGKKRAKSVEELRMEDRANSVEPKAFGVVNESARKSELSDSIDP